MDRGSPVARKAPLTRLHRNAQWLGIANVSTETLVGQIAPRERRGRDRPRVHSVGQGISVIIERA
jgi:hypothetical protein